MKLWNIIYNKNKNIAKELSNSWSKFDILFDIDWLKYLFTNQLKITKSNPEENEYRKRYLLSTTKERNSIIKSRYKKWKITLKELWKEYWISAERIRQIMLLSK